MRFVHAHTVMKLDVQVILSVLTVLAHIPYHVLSAMHTEPDLRLLQINIQVSTERVLYWNCTLQNSVKTKSLDGTKPILTLKSTITLILTVFSCFILFSSTVPRSSN